MNNRVQPQYPPEYPPPAQPAMAAPVDSPYEHKQPGGYGQPPPYPAHQTGQVHYASSSNAVVIAQPGVGTGMGYMPDNTSHIISACIVTWCCCFIFGIIAFVYACKYTGFALLSRVSLSCLTRFSVCV